MVAPTRPSAVNTTDASYSAVPNPQVGSPELNDPYANLSGANLPQDSYLSPEGVNTPILGQDSMHMPAPSMKSRTSTNESLLGGTPNLNSDRSSWASNAALAPGGADARRPGASRGQSNLQHSTVGWNNTSNDRLSVSDEDDGVGHVAPAGGVGAGAGAAAGGLGEKSSWSNDGLYTSKKKSRKAWWIAGGVGLLLVIGLAVGLGVGLTTNKSKSSSGGDSGAAAGGGGGSGGESTGTKTSHSPSSSSAAPSPVATSGGLGSLITLEDGSTMTYDNSFGGTWVWDPSNPFNNEAQAQNYTPALNQNWTWGVDKIYGVNLGGWLNTEPFIVPALYEKYANGSNGQTAIDEYTLSQNMGDNLTAAMTEHYETFITERDFAEIASAGLNWIRLPIAHWAIETWPEEPYLERVSWKYVLKAIQWARKYGIRIQLDLHTVPGSQNGWNHSGKIGQMNWMYGAMGYANAQRALDYIRTLAQFIAQPEYAPVVQMFGFINEPRANDIGQRAVGSFYHEAHNIIREVTGFGEGNGPFLSVHDGFIGISSWFNFLPGADRLALDQHPYMIFGDQQTGSLAQIATRPCSMWAQQTRDTTAQHGMNSAGEWSAAPNDCGLWVNSVGGGSRYDGTHQDYLGRGIGSCDTWNDYRLWDQPTKDSMLQLVLGSMDAFQNFFFWTWKIGNSTGPIAEVNPFWHYRLGLREGWIPKDPRTAAGTCAKNGISGLEFDGTFSQPFMTGGAGAGTIAATASSSYPWPPASFTNVAAADMTRLPQYTATGTPITMPAPSFTSADSTKTFNAGNGWFNAAVTPSAHATIAGCAYPPEYSAASVGVSAGACGAGSLQPTRRAI